MERCRLSKRKSSNTLKVVIQATVHTASNYTIYKAIMKVASL